MTSHKTQLDLFLEGILDAGCEEPTNDNNTNNKTNNNNNNNNNKNNNIAKLLLLTRVQLLLYTI